MIDGSKYDLPARRAVLLPAGLAFALALLALLPPNKDGDPRASILGASAVLLLLSGLLLATAQKGLSLKLEIVIRKQHYLQACAQGSVLLYWGWYWRTVYDSGALIAAQLIFVFAFDALVSWAKRQTHSLGFAPFPIIFSINLFLFFKPNWFYLQFVLIAVGILAKQLLHWEKEGRRAHIFNPSSFPLAVIALGLILSGTTDHTWAEQIATTQFFPPHIYLMLFLIGLPGQFLFGVTTMTFSAVVTTFLISLGYFQLTGTYFFVNSYIPIAVFLGMHLLFTDPSTAPRTELGRILFGISYGTLVVLTAALLEALDFPNFYDKLLPVPILNLSIRLIDRLARSRPLSWLDPAKLGQSLPPRTRNLRYITLWALVFGALYATGGLGDSHPGQWLPFWERACTEGRRNGCETLAKMERTYCTFGSGWACNALGILIAEGKVPNENATRSSGQRRSGPFRHACALGYAAGCKNAQVRSATVALERAPPAIDDYRIVLQTGKQLPSGKTPVSGMTPEKALVREACAQGWAESCGSR